MMKIIMKTISLFLIILFLFVPISPAFAKTKPVNDYSRLIPSKDDALIKKIPKKVMNDGELKKYLQQVSKKVEGTLSTEAKKNAELIIKEVKKKYNNNNLAFANAANGCAMTGHMEEALYIMGRACLENPSDTDNLNNYAAFLTMSKGGNLAIPILNKLNKQYPNNSTILNNLGQAWFSLGDTEESEKYLDAAIRAFPYHAQANYTKSIIEGSKGNKNAEIAALKSSITRSYNGSRANRLKKLGGKLDIQSDWGFHMPQDALGLEQFVIPPYPKNPEALGDATQQWTEFKQQLHQSYDKISAKNKILEKELDEKNAAKQKLFEKLIKSMDQKGLAKYAMQEKQNSPPFIAKAIAKLAMLNGEEGGQLSYYLKKEMGMNTQLNEVSSKIGKLLEEWEGEEYDAFQQMEKDQVDYSVCASKVDGLTKKYLPKSNSLWEEYNNDYVNYLKKKTNTLAYFAQYTTPGGDLGVQVAENRIKLDFLNSMANLNVTLGKGIQRDCSGFIPDEGGGSNSGTSKKNTSSAPGKLQDFYDLHCDHKVNVPTPFGTINVECNKMTTDFSVGPLSAKWKENLDTNSIINGAVELGFSKGGGLDYGPLAAEVSASAGGFMEFDDNSITDIGVKVGVGATSTAGPTTLGEIGAESRWGWNSGINTKGSGVLNGLSI